MFLTSKGNNKGENFKAIFFNNLQIYPHLIFDLLKAMSTYAELKHGLLMTSYKTGSLPSFSHISTTVQLHKLDSKETLWEKARWELHKDSVYSFEQIMESTPYKTAVV